MNLLVTGLDDFLLRPNDGADLIHGAIVKVCRTGVYDAR
jgi:hypothetical protein